MNLGFIRLQSNDFSRLRREFIVISCISAFFLIIIISSHYLNDLLKQRQTEKLTQLEEITNQLSEVENELSTIKEFTPQYQQLIDRGVIGAEQRLEWIELLERLQQELNVPGLQYRFAAQENYPLPPSSPLQHHKFFSSPLSLVLFPLHEEQAAMFLTELEKQASGFPLIRQCEMRPGSAGPAAAHLTVDCQYDWLTLKSGIAE